MTRALMADMTAIVPMSVGTDLGAATVDIGGLAWSLTPDDAVRLAGQLALAAQSLRDDR